VLSVCLLYSVSREPEVGRAIYRK